MIVPVPRPELVRKVQKELQDAEERIDKILNGFKECEHCALPKACARLESCLQSRRFAIR
jgi:hypothetical protein